MKIAIGEISHETNSFSVVKPDEKMFRSITWFTGKEIIKESNNVRNYMGGIIDKAKELCIEVVPMFEDSTITSVVLSSGP